MMRTHAIRDTLPTRVASHVGINASPRNARKLACAPAYQCRYESTRVTQHDIYIYNVLATINTWYLNFNSIRPVITLDRAHIG